MSLLPFLKNKPKTKPNGIKAASPAANPLTPGLTSIQDIIAPPAIDVDFTHLKIGNTFIRTLFVAGYPRFVNANWLSPLINFDHSLDISMFIYPVEGKSILDDLHRKITEMEAEIQSDVKRGKIPEVSVEIKLEDAKNLQVQLAKGAEKFFQFGLYLTITASSLEQLETISKQVQSTLGSLLIITKTAALQMEDGLKTTLPTGIDHLLVTRNMDTTSLATTFPFTSSDLTANEGILYGINEHNESLVIFDRFTLENANSVVFAKSGAGKSYMVKLETLRSLMFGIEVITIDPENEYQTLCNSVGGEYITFDFSSRAKINPFDLSAIYEEGENELGQKIISLHSLLKVMLGKVSPQEEALLDRALISTYKSKGITPDPATQKYEPPLMEDLYKTLIGMETKEALSISARLEKYVKGSFRGIFDQRTNINLQNQFTVFSIKELEGELRPIAMFIILDYIWTRIKKKLKKRLLVVDEAWYLMKYPDTAKFIYSIAKRARKYYLGLTTITQDVEDFLHSDHGKAIVTNSSIQILMKQSTAAIDEVAKIFYLSQGERHLLLSADIGQGLFFAGNNHVAIRVIASPDEHKLITTKPQEILKRKTQTPSTETTPTKPTQTQSFPIQPPLKKASPASKNKRPSFTTEVVPSPPPPIPPAPKPAQP